jgi:hypothetical protein
MREIPRIAWSKVIPSNLEKVSPVPGEGFLLRWSYGGQVVGRGGSLRGGWSVGLGGW